MQNHLAAEQIANEVKSRDLNEADTRHHIINRLLHEILAWPVSSVHCEEKVHAGYIDIALRDKAGRPVLVIEAKRTGRHFNLPHRTKQTPDKHKMVRLRTLVTDKNIYDAVNQVALYCQPIGCRYACITNGIQFVLFQPFIQGSHFLDSDAFVITGFEFFSEHYTRASELLSYQAVVSDRSLQTLFENANGGRRDLFYPKSAISHYDTPFGQNHLARYLEPIARRYFKEIKISDKHLMENCYVFSRETMQVQAGMRARLSDSISPYFAAVGTQNIDGVRSGGKLAQRIANVISKDHDGEVLILFGGKGAGKSTFLRRVLFYEPPQELELHAFPIIIDCLSAPQSNEGLTNHFWATITEALATDNLLGRPMDQMLKLFEDRFEIAKRQELAGLEEGSNQYILERNRLVAEWKKDSLYVARRLKLYRDREGKRAVIAFDNTDQLTPSLQDHCFLSAQDIARSLHCVAIISMREERYCRARTAGVLDAYQNTSYHLAAPELLGVFTKRIRLVIKDLQAPAYRSCIPGLDDETPFEELCSFFRCCENQFSNEGNALRKFLQECSRDNVRLALDFFGQFLTSGYTHVAEMVTNPRWTVIEHQVIRPMMVPQRHNYDEDKSMVPNLYQNRTSGRGSHFTALRILRALRHGITTAPERGGYRRVDSLLDYFESKFGMRQDCEAAIDIMLKQGIVEANNRLDRYKVERSTTDIADPIFADEIRITAFGVYALDFLAPAFTYLDLVSLDSGISEEGLYEQFVIMATRERAHAINGEKEERLESRIARVESFLQYLKREEDREKSEFLLVDNETILTALVSGFQTEKIRVLASAARNLRRPN